MAKTIVVPKNKEAEIALDYDTATPDQVIELILSNDEFNKLWSKGVFSLINSISQSNIDDFEDEHIIDLNLIYNSCRELKKNFNDISEIIKMFELALMYRTSIHFYF
ncbi:MULTISPECIES: hypothetical protein [Elizabethkingia]|uniref:Uncharacterized protein n=2 Tax=Elizabethkingia anophelis TaxID=1117645 RepID=A0A1T3DEI5_9FLAO|nr:MULTISPECIES: hypothetical protein [Elizabethkingia]AKH93444.1 hypothetical protein M876_02545 [Elizabethkingia anophelis FMS-007]AQW89875.1 hypothetical protein BBD28_04025 [Elizabethkingia anophelis]AQW98399.1 hypothetical protein BBD31_11060 [Elizabethkingia anophelis]AQX50653.1 hypothetical protein AYC66_08180 [Elizabethkingia anophelis]AQX88961.1 hypothetical protein AYC67_07960 [Elizabethkingia anophelis]